MSKLMEQRRIAHLIKKVVYYSNWYMALSTDERDGEVGKWVRERLEWYSVAMCRYGKKII